MLNEVNHIYIYDEAFLCGLANGNGALCAVKTKDYIDFEPIRCHDSAMPYYFALKKLYIILMQ